MSEENRIRKKRGRPRIHPSSNGSPYVKVGQGTPLRSQARELVCNVRDYFIRESENGGPLLSVKKVVERTSAALNINKNTVLKIYKEKQHKIAEGECSKLQTPNKKRKTIKRVTQLDTFQQEAIRRHVHGYFSRKEHPTLKKLMVSLKEADLFRGSRSSLYVILKRIGFCYKNINKRRILLERNDVIAKRCKFLREIRKEDFDNIIWLDETWVNTGHSLTKGWTDDTVQGTMAVPIGKGQRLILLHAGSSRGFVPNCLLLFSSKNTCDYHEEMNHQRFYTWFKESLLPNLENSSLIVMDNAPYHSKILDKAPSISSKKVEMVEWLQQHNIQFGGEMKKAELMELINANKPQRQLYVIDELAKNHGHKVIRLPPYHCHFNSIEMIWAQIKGYVARNNKKFNLSETKQLIHEGIKGITDVEWKKVVAHTKKVITDAWEYEGLLEEAVEEIVISLSNEDTDSSSDEGCDIDDISQRNSNEWFEDGTVEDNINDDVYIYEQCSSEMEEELDDCLSGVFPLVPREENVLGHSVLKTLISARGPRLAGTGLATPGYPSWAWFPSSTCLGIGPFLLSSFLSAFLGQLLLSSCPDAIRVIRGLGDSFLNFSYFFSSPSVLTVAV